MDYNYPSQKVPVILQILKAILCIGFVVYILFVLLLFIDNLPFEFLRTFRHWLLYSNTYITEIIFVITTICIFVPFGIFTIIQTNEKINRLFSCKLKTQTAAEENQKTNEQLENCMKKLNSIDTSIEKQKENYGRVTDACRKLKSKAELNVYTSIDTNDKLNIIAAKNKHLAKTLGFKNAWKKYNAAYKKLYDDDIEL